MSDGNPPLFNNSANFPRAMHAGSGNNWQGVAHPWPRQLLPQGNQMGQLMGQMSGAIGGFCPPQYMPHPPAAARAPFPAFANWMHGQGGVQVLAEQQPPPQQQAQLGGQFPAEAQNSDSSKNVLGGNAQAPAESESEISIEIQEAANAYVGRIFQLREGAAIGDFLRRMRGFHQSKDVRENQLHECLLKILLEEFRFVHEYPREGLMMMAEMYGGLIRENSLSRPQFLDLMGKITTSLKSDPFTSMFAFGVHALHAAKERICTNQNLCYSLMKMPNFTHLPDQLTSYIKHAFQNPQPLAAAPARSEEYLMSSQSLSATEAKSMEMVLRIREKEGTLSNKPSDATQEQVAFICNNLDKTNMAQKVEELQAIIEQMNGNDDFIKWLAHELVKRATSEPKNLPLYDELQAALDNKDLEQHVRHETMKNIKVILLSDKESATTNYQDRTLLKNLGTWLGSTTIARSKAIALEDLDLKSLLLEAYSKGIHEMLYAVPFVCKVLLGAAKSEAFRPTSSWMHNVLKTLGQLHTVPDLKINLKFEIEVLCKEIGISLAEISGKMPGVLDNPQLLSSLRPQLSTRQPTGLKEVLSSLQQFPQELCVRQIITSNPEAPPPVADADAGHDGWPSFRLNYDDISVSSLEGLLPHLQMAHPLIENFDGMANAMKSSLVRAIREVLDGIIPQTKREALSVCSVMMRKDFGYDTSSPLKRQAIRGHLRSMCSAFAYKNAQEPLKESLLRSCQEAFLKVMRVNGRVDVDKKTMHDALYYVVGENFEVGMAFIVKTICESTIHDLARSLDQSVPQTASSSLELRRLAAEHAAKISLLPARLQWSPDTLGNQEYGLYESLSSNLCGFKMAEDDQALPAQQAQAEIEFPDVGAEEQFVEQLRKMIKDGEQVLSTTGPQEAKQSSVLVSFLHKMRSLLADPSNQQLLLATLSQALFQFLYVYTPSLYQGLPGYDAMKRVSELLLTNMQTLRNKSTELQMGGIRLTGLLIECQHEYRFNHEAIEVLIRENMISCAEYDKWLAEVIDTEPSNSRYAMEFSQNLFRHVTSIGVSREQFEARFPRLSQRFQKADGKNYLADKLVSSRTAQQKAFPEIPAAPSADVEYQRKVERVIREWLHLYYGPQEAGEVETLAKILPRISEGGFLSSNEAIERFLTVLQDVCVDICYRLLKNETADYKDMAMRQRSYYTVDAIVALFCFILKYSNGDPVIIRVSLLKKFLVLLTKLMMADHDTRREGEFNPVPYHRIIVAFLAQAQDPASPLADIRFQTLDAIGQTLLFLQPRRAPQFAIAWLDIVGSRQILELYVAASKPQVYGEASSVEDVKTRANYVQFLICQLKFLAPWLRREQMSPAITAIYKGTMRILLLLLHDAPDLLCEYHYVLCDNVPPNAIQLRNLILSAYPVTTYLPNPFEMTFTEIVKIPNMALDPKMNLEPEKILPVEMRTRLENYLLNRLDIDLVTSLPHMLASDGHDEIMYNATVLHALVLYVGQQAVASIKAKRQEISLMTIAHTAYMDVFQNLAIGLCNQGRYLLLHAIANQLRFPSAHTNYFIHVLLYLFKNADLLPLKEQIVRCVFERVLSMRPHPWGLVVIVIELMKNPDYGFWEEPFVAMAPELQEVLVKLSTPGAQYA
ncbi:unnamed protein product, partial [Mesorhabditis spiculigera]